MDRPQGRPHMLEGMVNSVYAWLRGFPIRTRLRLVLLVVVAVLAAALLIMLNSIVASYEASVGFISTQLVASISDDMRTGINSLMNTTKYPIVWEGTLPTDTYTYLSYPHLYKSSQLDADLESRSTYLFEQNRLMRLIAVFDLEGKGSYVKNTRKYLYQVQMNRQTLSQESRVLEHWFVETLRADGRARVWNHTQVPIEDAYLQDTEDMIFVSRAIINIDRFEPVGVILAAMDMSGTVQEFEAAKVYDAQQIGFFDEAGSLLWGDMHAEETGRFLAALPAQTGQGGIASFQVGTGAQRVIYHFVESISGYYCVLATPYNMMLAAVFREKLLLLLGLVIGFVLISVMINSIVRSIREPVNSLVKTCNTIVAESDFSITIDDPYRDELSELTASFNNLTQRIEYLIHEVYEKQMELSQTQLQLLRSQVNPHFLYNALETIRTKAFLCGHHEVSDMTLLLASLLRYGISAPSELVTVETEMQKLTDYIGLQHMLYGNCFELTVNIEPEILSCWMLKFILQPIVENALNHGINQMDRGGTIDVLGYQEEDTIVLQVSDNGKGIPEDVLRDLRDFLDNKNEKFSSIGLKNVHRRIRLYYGPDYGVTVASRENSGTMISVRIPKDTKGGRRPDGA